jgi:phosphatidylinositol 3-kinase
VQTSYKSFKNARNWNQWLELPISIATLPLNAQLAITVWDLSPTGGEGAQGHAIPFGGTTVPLFGQDDTLQKGKHKCKLYRHKTADGFSNTTTPADPPPERRGKKGEQVQVTVPTKQELELERLEAVFKKHEMGEIPRVDWLDKLVFEEVAKRQQEVENMQRQARRRQRAQANESGDNGVIVGSEERFTLTVEFPRFDFPVVFTDYEYKPTPISNQALHGSNINLKPPPEVQYGPGIQGSADANATEDDEAPPLIRIYDPEVGQKDNPVENKHRRLVRSHRTGVLDRDLRPNAKIRDELNTIMDYGPTQELNSEEKDLIWKFRHHLTREKRGLTKFIKAVSWNDQTEVRQAIQLLPKWTEIDIDDALELLGPTYDNSEVRAYAVTRLRKADDDELLLYLLQLVQALKFDKPSEDPRQDSSLAAFLVSRASENFVLGNYLHWYLMVECSDPSPMQQEHHRKLYARVDFDYMRALEATAGGEESRKQLRRQAELITMLSKVSDELKPLSNSRPKMVEHVKKYLADPRNEMLTFDPPIQLPLDPQISIVGVYPDECNVFKSTMHPILLNFKKADGGRYTIIFKKGDDLRQDQLVIQIISLMDRLLRKENLDLKLTPFSVLAASTQAGAVQFVPSSALQVIKGKYSGNYIMEYLKVNNPDKKAEYGVRKEAMDNYIKSCAGYCVVTYLLGVGDRHLDNLLLTPDGRFFHIDFGYILGRDPKPAPPPIKITLPMVDGMGGMKSDNFAAFQQYCFTAFLALRKSSSLILNLFALMTDAHIADIEAEPDKVVEKVRERFSLGLSEEEAMREFRALIEDSLSRLVPQIIDGIHDLVQRYRG